MNKLKTKQAKRIEKGRPHRTAPRSATGWNDSNGKSTAQHSAAGPHVSQTQWGWGPVGPRGAWRRWGLAYDTLGTLFSISASAGTSVCSEK